MMITQSDNKDKLAPSTNLPQAIVKNVSIYIHRYNIYMITYTCIHTYVHVHTYCNT